MLSPKITFSQLYAHHLFGLPLPEGKNSRVYCRECGGIIDKGSEIGFEAFCSSDKWTYEDSLWYKSSWVTCPACYVLRQPAGERSPVRSFFPVNENTGEIDKSINSIMRTKLCLKNKEGLLVHKEGILVGRVTLSAIVDFARQKARKQRNGGDSNQSGSSADYTGPQQEAAEEMPTVYEILDLLEAGKVVPPFACVVGQEIGDAQKIGYYFWNVPLNWSVGEEVAFYLVGTRNSVVVNVRWRAVKKICEKVAMEYPGLLESIRNGKESSLFEEEAKMRGVPPKRLLNEAREKALAYQGITPEERKVLEGLFRI